MTPDEEAEAEIEIARARAAKAKAPKIQPAPVEPMEPGAFDPQTKAGTALRGFGRGASYGLTDDLAGASGALQELGSRGPLGRVASLAAPVAMGPLAGPAMLASAGSAPEVLTGSDAQLGEFQDKPLVEAMIARFRSDRERSRREQDTSAKANPKMFAATELAGAVATPGPKFAAKPGGLTRAGALVATGGAQGAMYGAGTSKADSGDGVGVDALKGYLGGAVAAPLASAAGNAAGRGLERLGLTSALKAMGARAGITESLGKRGYESVDDGLALAKDAMDSGVIRFGRTADDVARQAAERQQNVSGPIIDDVITRADASPQPFDFQEASWTAADKLMSRGRPVAAPLNPQEQAVGHGAMNMVKRIADTTTGEGLGSFAEANRLKQGLQDSVNYGVNATKESMQMQRAAAAGMRESVESQVARAVDPEAAETLKAANKGWGTMKDVKEIALDEARRQAQRKLPIWSAALGGVAGSTAGGLAGGLGGAASMTAAHYLAPRAPSVMAHAARAISPAVGPASGRAAAESVADPMGPLREYLGLSPEERLDASAQAFGGSK